MRRFTPSPCRVVFAGQSRVIAPSWMGSDLFGYSWCRIAMAGLGVTSTDKPAKDGTSLTTLSAEFDAGTRPYIAPPSLEPTIFVLCGGFTDYFGENNTGAQVYADAWAYTDKARAAGAQYVICTTTIISNVFSAAQETERQAGNALILADASNKFDAVVDFDVPGLDDPDDTSVFVDGVHIYGFGHDTSKGTGKAAAVARPVIQAAIAAVTA